MPAFPDDRFPLPMRDDLLSALRAAWDRLARPGAVFGAEDRLGLAAAARGGHAEAHRPPWSRAPAPDGVAGRIAHEVGAGTQRIDRGWAVAHIAGVGEAAYVEAVATAATVVTADVFAAALGVARDPLPEPIAGEPSGRVADATEDIGAYVPVAVATAGGANVGRALSLVPDAVALFFGVERAFYAAGEEFQALVWDRALSRPQVELVAARTSAVNECFY